MEEKMKKLIILLITLLILSGCASKEEKINNCTNECTKQCVDDKFDNGSGLPQFGATAKYCNYLCEKECKEKYGG